MATKPTEKPTEEKTPAEKVDFAKEAKQLVQDYMVPMSEGSLKKATENMDEKSFAAFQEYVKKTAEGLYPTMAKQIASGIPTAHLMEPYRQVGKQVLGEQFEPNFVGDPKSSAALTGAMDPETMRPAPMSLDQWKQHLQTHPGFGWDQTPAAKESAQQIIQHIMEGFTNPPQGAK